MKIKEQQNQEEIKINIEMVINPELEALGKEFVKAAIRNGYNKTRTLSILKAIWNEAYRGMNPKPHVDLERETLEEKDFRKLATEWISKNENILSYSHYRLQYTEDGERKASTALLEIICAMYKIFKNPEIERPTKRLLIAEASKRLTAICDDDSYHMVTDINRAYDRLMVFCKKEQRNHINDGFIEWSMKYEHRIGSVGEQILLMVWLIKERSKRWEC